MLRDPRLAGLSSTLSTAYRKCLLHRLSHIVVIVVNLIVGVDIEGYGRTLRKQLCEVCPCLGAPCTVQNHVQPCTLCHAVLSNSYSRVLRSVPARTPLGGLHERL
eukprot:5382923-Pyramimonas_sp.AAC.1